MVTVLSVASRRQAADGLEGARWYDPTVGRWLSEDPSGLTVDADPYRYAGNAPTNATDPSGLERIKGNKYGEWGISQTNTDKANSTGLFKVAGSTVIVAFHQNNKCDCDEIAFVQIGRIVGTNGTVYKEPRENIAGRMTKDGWAVDRAQNEKLGWFEYSNEGKPKDNLKPGHGPDGEKSPAVLGDNPRTNDTNVRYEFETFAICKKGNDAAKVYGYLYWGFEVDANGAVTSLKPTAHDATSTDFDDAVTAWNNQANGPAASRNAPDQAALPAFTK